MAFGLKCTIPSWIVFLLRVEDVGLGIKLKVPLLLLVSTLATATFVLMPIALDLQNTTLVVKPPASIAACATVGDELPSLV